MRSFDDDPRLKVDIKRERRFYEDQSASLSNFITLRPGVVISTGTPPGVGMGHKPPMYLKAGDVMTLGARGLGEQRQTVVASPAA